MDFQCGSCPGGRGASCFRNPCLSHPCNKCIAGKHGGNSCNLSPKEPIVTSGGKGKSKGKGKRQYAASTQKEYRDITTAATSRVKENSDSGAPKNFPECQDRRVVPDASLGCHPVPFLLRPAFIDCPPYVVKFAEQFFEQVQVYLLDDIAEDFFCEKVLATLHSFTDYVIVPPRSTFTQELRGNTPPEVYGRANRSSDAKSRLRNQTLLALRCAELAQRLQVFRIPWIVEAMPARSRQFSTFRRSGNSCLSQASLGRCSTSVRPGEYGPHPAGDSAAVFFLNSLSQFVRPLMFDDVLGSPQQTCVQSQRVS